MTREFIYILDYSAPKPRVIKTKIAVSESHLEGEDLVDAVMCRLDLKKDDCAWMITTRDLYMEEVPIEKISAENYAKSLKMSHPELSVFYHPNPAHNVVVVGLIKDHKNVGLDKDFRELLELDSKELGVELVDLMSVDQVQNMIEVK